MSDAEVITALLVAVAAVAATAAAARVAHPVALVTAGLALGFVPGVPAPEIDPDVVFLLFLPPLLYAAAHEIADEDLRRYARPIGFLAIGLVLATVGAVALAAHYVVGLDWAPAFVLGAVVGPTDPVAATSLTRRLGAPPRVATVLEGESLVNDAVALVALGIAIEAVAQAPTVGHTALELFGSAGGGVGVGVVAGWLCAQARRRSHQSAVDIPVALAATYAAFLAADLLGASGILASVATGLYVGRSSARLSSPEGRIESRAFFTAMVFLVESALFLLSGLAFQQVLERLGDRAPLELVGQAALVVGVVAGLRALWMFTVPEGWAMLGGSQAMAPKAERAVLALSSMRGAVTVAASLSIPVAVAGVAFPDRDLVLLLAYSTVFCTLVFPTLALGPVLRRLGLTGSEAQQRRSVEARLALAHAALERVEELASDGAHGEDELGRARDYYGLRISELESERREAAGEPEDDPDSAQAAASYRELRGLLLSAERERLAMLQRDEPLPGDALREIERNLDLQSARLR